jgi:hypothetical protein
VGDSWGRWAVEPFPFPCCPCACRAYRPCRAAPCLTAPLLGRRPRTFDPLLTPPACLLPQTSSSLSLSLSLSTSFHTHLLVGDLGTRVLALPAATRYLAACTTSTRYLVLAPPAASGFAWRRLMLHQIGRDSFQSCKSCEPVIECVDWWCES